MKPLLDSRQTNLDVLPVVVWIAKANHPPYREALDIIRDWWVGIAGKQVSWEVVVGIGGSNSLTYQCRIDQTRFRDGILHYCTSTTERYHFVPVKELYLDLELQMLTAVTDSSLNMTYRIRLLEETPTPGRRSHFPPQLS